MPIKLNSSGGGSVTLDLGSTASIYTQTLPLFNGSLVGADSVGRVSFSNTVTVSSYGIKFSDNSIQTTAAAATPNSLSTASGSAPSYSARAWANYNGQTDTLNGAGNLTVSRTGAGQYSFSFITAMPDANYAVTVGLGDVSGVGNEHHIVSSLTTSGFLVKTSLSGDSWGDVAFLGVAVFR
jgi:hypothetical protein